MQRREPMSQRRQLDRYGRIPGPQVDHERAAAPPTSSGRVDHETAVAWITGTRPLKLSYDNRYADLFFEVVSRRYDGPLSIVLSTNKPFGEWSTVFPHAACVVTLVDRLLHRAEVLSIEGDSYRLKEAKDRTATARARRPRKRDTSPEHAHP